MDSDAGKCPQPEPYFSECGPLNLWDPLWPNTLNTPKTVAE